MRCRLSLATSSFLSTPSARRATRQAAFVSVYRIISIHALREEGDETFSPALPMVSYFYPRPPRGGRRGAGFPDNAVVQFLSTPSARRATVPRLSGFVEVTISIHALREEGDSALHTRLRCAGTISIHALREEGDPRLHRSATDTSHFYPRPPRGGRLRKPWRTSNSQKNFYPRPPRGGRPDDTDAS